MCKRKNILDYYKHIVDFYLDFVWRHILCETYILYVDYVSVKVDRALSIESYYI